MKNIPSESVCTFFYAFFIIYAILFALSILVFFGIVGYAKKLGAAGIGMGIQALIATGITGTSALFVYLICDRALLANKPAPKQVGY